MKEKLKLLQEALKQMEQSTKDETTKAELIELTYFITDLIVELHK